MDLGIDIQTGLVLTGVMIGALTMYKAMTLLGGVFVNRSPKFQNLLNGNKEKCTDGVHCGEDVEPIHKEITNVIIRREVSEIKEVCSKLKEGNIRTAENFKQLSSKQDITNEKLQQINDNLLTLPHELAKELK